MDDLSFVHHVPYMAWLKCRCKSSLHSDQMGELMHVYASLQYLRSYDESRTSVFKCLCVLKNLSHQWLIIVSGTFAVRPLLKLYMFDDVDPEDFVQLYNEHNDRHICSNRYMIEWWLQKWPLSCQIPVSTESVFTCGLVALLYTLAATITDDAKWKLGDLITFHARLETLFLFEFGVSSVTGLKLLSARSAMSFWT